ncbi:MAG TPA: acetyl-CoA decarbonylase/synthase complex subunit gamma [Methanoregulaceae archaeon]|nr:acetyl-CoA decarbonylase/synthase complex subunit gamma [Methanoregulaceae archaeon]
MALKALDIYKLLPKKNCKECGDPTCLTFAMKLASGKGDVEKCPYLDETAKNILGASTRPPIQLVKVGVGEKRLAIGEEFVLFRHEKTFYHPPGIMFLVSDLWSREKIETVTRRVASETLTRVGTELSFSGMAIRSESGDPMAFEAAVRAVEETDTHLPEVLIAKDPVVQQAGLSVCGNFRPLIYAATHDTYKTMCVLARKYGCPLVVSAGSPEGCGELTKLCAAEGVPSLLIDLSLPSLGDYIPAATMVRQKAICRSSPELGYPIFFDTTRYMQHDAAIVLGIDKYAGIIVTNDLPPGSAAATLTLRQNIYTDPQKPIQMNPGMYPVGEPGKDAPVLLTVNFSLTYFTLQGYLEATKIPCYMLVVDTEGLSVLTAVAAGKLNETLVKESIKRFGVEDLVSHRRLIIPGYASPLSGKIEEETGWQVLVGPRDAADIGEYLVKEWNV